MSIEAFVYLLVFLVILSLYVLPVLRGPFKNRVIHILSEKVQFASLKHYEDVINAHPNFDDKELLEQYARLTEKLIQAFLMYQESGNLRDINDVEKHADYWMKSKNYLDKKTKNLEEKYGFQVVPLNPENYFGK